MSKKIVKSRSDFTGSQLPESIVVQINEEKVCKISKPSEKIKTTGNPTAQTCEEKSGKSAPKYQNMQNYRREREKVVKSKKKRQE